MKEHRVRRPVSFADSKMVLNLCCHHLSFKYWTMEFVINKGMVDTIRDLAEKKPAWYEYSRVIVFDVG